MATSQDAELESISRLLTPVEILNPGSAGYERESKTWAVQRNLHPKLVARPKDVDSLSRLVAAMHDTGLEYAVRSQGYGSSSAKDVLISITAFDSFEYDLGEKTITIGAGQCWSGVDEKIDQHCPGYATLSTRCGFLGVGGTIVYGGLSWASSERGMAATPDNLLDAQVVKANGEVVWASNDEDLMWCLRGGGHSFGIVTKVKVKIFEYPSQIFSGRVVYPRSSLNEIAKEVSAWTERVTDPKLCFHLYCLNVDENKEEKGKYEIGSRQDTWSRGMERGQISFWLYDAHGEEHAKSEEGFAWAYRITGAKDMTMNLSFTEVNKLADSLKVANGVTDSWMSAPLIPHMSEDVILRAWEWFESVNNALPGIQDVPLGVLVLIEMLQKPAIHTDSPRTDTAWPHTHAQHVLQLCVAAPVGDLATRKELLNLIQEAPKIISPGHQDGDYLPNFVQDFNDVAAIYGPNFEKLQQLKERYDPKGRLGGPFIKTRSKPVL